MFIECVAAVFGAANTVGILARPSLSSFSPGSLKMSLVRGKESPADVSLSIRNRMREEELVES